MLDIDEMGRDEIYELLNKIGYGHIGFIHEDKPYVMPMHYYLEGEEIYMFTTEGMKTHDIDVSPEICLQVEEIIDDPLHWRSVIVTGQAKRLTEKAEIERVRKLIKEVNPTLSPALNRTWIDSWGRAEVVAIYRVYPSEMSGRTTDGVSSRMMRA
jgi:nitroimidazol reductase NimA-like FMN-containing flavoprotein (pyridoxamine 5'-phosphate oxidase superfamily)